MYFVILGEVPEDIKSRKRVAGYIEDQKVIVPPNCPFCKDPVYIAIANGVIEYILCVRDGRYIEEWFLSDSISGNKWVKNGTIVG